MGWLFLRRKQMNGYLIKLETLFRPLIDWKRSVKSDQGKCQPPLIEGQGSNHVAYGVLL